MIRLISFAAFLAKGLGYVGAFAVVAMMLHICLDIVLRSSLRLSLDTVPEIVARYYMTALAFLPLAWLEIRRDMISVELLDFALSDTMRNYSDSIVMILATLVYGLLAWTNWDKAFSETSVGHLVEVGTYKMPVWHSFYFSALGFSFAALICALLTIGALVPAYNQPFERARDER